MKIAASKLRQIIREEVSRIREEDDHEHEHDMIYDQAYEMLQRALSPDEMKKFLGLTWLYTVDLNDENLKKVKKWRLMRSQVKRLLVSAALGKKVKSIKARHIPRLLPYLDEYLGLVNKAIDDIQDDGKDSFVDISKEIMSNPLSASILKRRWRS
tara:strand:+ start:107 stop:571 length:465 start_codon:yes stop_codon:yes gene_type:complete